MINSTTQQQGIKLPRGPASREPAKQCPVLARVARVFLPPEDQALSRVLESTIRIGTVRARSFSTRRADLTFIAVWSREIARCIFGFGRRLNPVRLTLTDKISGASGAMPKYNPKSTAPEQLVATKILEIMQGVSLAEAWHLVNQPKPNIPETKLGWSAELIRNVLAKRSYDTSLRVVDDALGLLHESGRVSKTVGVFGFDTYELIGARRRAEAE